MTLVGNFPGIDFNRRTIRGPVNPMDKSTIVSIFPREIDETKHTIQPGRFFIPAGSYDHPSTLVIGPSSWWKELDENQPLLEIPTSSVQIADSVVKDYCNGLLGCNMADEMPGLYYLSGDVKVEQLKTAPYKNHIDLAKANQTRWYRRLVQMADSLWARTNGNPLAISDIMRLAANELGLGNKEWLQNYKQQEVVRCVACGSMRNPAYPICPTCKAVVDVEMAKKLNLKFAE